MCAAQRGHKAVVCLRFATLDLRNIGTVRLQQISSADKLLAPCCMRLAGRHAQMCGSHLTRFHAWVHFLSIDVAMMIGLLFVNVLWKSC